MKMARLKLFTILIMAAKVYPGAMKNFDRKCCAKGQVFDYDSTCTNTRHSERRFIHPAYMENGSEIFSCNDDPKSMPTTHLCNDDFLHRTNLTGRVFCLEHAMNGSLMIQICPTVTNNVSGCDGIFTKIRFWGADIAMHMNIVHVVLCFIVVILYLVFFDLGRRTYNRAVLRHNACLLCMGCNLTIIGVLALCHQDVSDTVIVLMWLTLQFFTLASAAWLNVICFDMTLVITRFRWMFGSFDNNEREENRKFVVYGIFAWGGSIIPTLVAGISALFPEGSISPVFRVDYTKYKGGPNLTVNLYFFLVPLVTLFFNNILFFYTSYRIFMIQRSTAFVIQNQVNALSKKYFLFLRLYLLMGAPWFFGMLMACLNQLWILKTCRIVQPILWLLMLVTHKKVRQRIADNLGLSRSDNNQSCENIVE